MKRGAKMTMTYTATINTAGENTAIKKTFDRYSRAEKWMLKKLNALKDENLIGTITKCGVSTGYNDTFIMSTCYRPLWISR